MGGEIAFLLHLCHILQTPARLFAVSSGLARSSVPVGEGGVRAWLEYFGRKLAVFVQSFDRLGSFVAPEAWEETSPKPLEKRKPRWKNQAKLQPWLQRPTDRYFVFLAVNLSRLFVSFFAMCCVNGVLHVPSSIPTTLTRHSGKVATCGHYHRR